MHGLTAVRGNTNKQHSTNRQNQHKNRVSASQDPESGAHMAIKPHDEPQHIILVKGWTAET